VEYVEELRDTPVTKYGDIADADFLSVQAQDVLIMYFSTQEHKVNVEKQQQDAQQAQRYLQRAKQLGLEDHDVNLLGRYHNYLKTLRDDQSIEEWRKGITSEMPFELEMTVVKAISLEHESQTKSQARVDSRVAKPTGSQVQGGAGTGARPQTTSGAHPMQQQNRGSLNVSKMASTSMNDSSVFMDDSVDPLEEKQARIMELRQNEQHARQPQGNFKKPKSSLLSSHAAGAPIQKPTAVSQSTQQPKQAPAPVQTQAPRPAPVPTNNISPGHYQQAPVSAPLSQAPNPFGSTGNIPPASYQQQQPQYALGPNPAQGFPNYPIPQQAPAHNVNPFAEPEEKNHFGPLAVNPQPTNNFNPFLD